MKEATSKPNSESNAILTCTNINSLCMLEHCERLKSVSWIKLNLSANFKERKWH